MVWILELDDKGSSRDIKETEDAHTEEENQGTISVVLLQAYYFARVKACEVRYKGSGLEFILLGR